MRHIKRPLLCLLLATMGSMFPACAKHDSPAGSSVKTTISLPTSALTNGPTLPALSGNNVLELTVNGSNCMASSGYPNKPCVSVQVCAPGSATNCQIINGILLDTGSFGLRVFKSVLNATLSNALSPLLVSGKSLAECVHFGDGSSEWGPVAQANVVLGGEPSVTVPIHLIDSGFAGLPAGCSNPDLDPAHVGFNGILGVGLFGPDCGVSCAQSDNNNMYYACSGSGSAATCAPTAASLANQIQNPVSLLPKDNNGVILELPSMGLGGAPSINGYLVLGIGTQPDNTPSGVNVFTADPNLGEFLTTFNGQTYSSFLDSGSNGLFFPPTNYQGLADCGATNSGAAGYFCPTSPLSPSGIVTASGGVPSTNVPFQIGNFLSLMASPNNVFIELGASSGSGVGAVFDWGLPFFVGRNVYVGIEGRPSNLGVGPYWAF